MKKVYLNELIEVEERKEDEFHCYLCVLFKQKLAILYGKESLEIFLTGLGVKETNHEN